MSGDRIIVNDLPALAQCSAEWIARALNQITSAAPTACIALTGGATVRPVYERLADPSFVSLPWNAVQVFFGDERAVPPNHPDSNFRLAYEALLSKVPVPEGRIHRMPADRSDLDDAAREYESLLPPAFDLLLLGMGPEGHIASIFPGSPTVTEARRRVVPAFGGVPRLPRLTITPPVIRSAHRVLMMVEGKEKAAAVARALEGPDRPRELPARMVRERTWILDRAAAAALHSEKA